MNHFGWPAGPRCASMRAAQGRRGPSCLSSARRPSLCQRAHPPGPRAQKGLKDFVVKSKTMAGFDAPYVPGYDCHGLPIEIKVDEQLGRKKLEMPVPAVLDACRAYAQKYIDLQTSQFERIGCFGRWDNPYKTMSRDYEARTLEAFYGFLEKGFVYRGLKPVYWCIHDRTALAEAEVEYEMHTSPSVYVRYQLTSDAETALDPCCSPAARSTPSSGPPLPGRCPRRWPSPSIPTSNTLRSPPAGDPKTPGHQPPTRSTSSPPNWPPSVIAACKLGADRRNSPASKAAKLERVTFQHPFLDRSILGVLATYVTADTGTGAVHTAPSHGADDFYTGQRYDLDQTCRVDAAGHIHVDPDAWPLRRPAAFDGLKVWAANPIIVAMLEERRALLGSSDLEHSYPHCWRCHNPVIFRATEQWFISP